jgi:gluconokinase
MKNSDRISFSVRWADLIKRTNVDNSGIIFVPYIYGERAPIWQPEATGSFHGIKHFHSPDNFARATVEGMLMNLRTIVEIVDQDPNTQVILSGGVFKIEGFAQLCSDILNRPVKILNHTNLSARGAAILVWRTFGTQREASEVDSKEYAPDLTNSEIYTSQFTKFKTLLNSYQLQ